MEDGRIAYRMKRPLPDGTTHLLFTGLELLRRVASLVPPPRANLTRFHGVFAPGAQLRPLNASKTRLLARTRPAGTTQANDRRTRRAERIMHRRSSRAGFTFLRNSCQRI
ncbi:transposase [Stigmatella sp. ncwal1]|uniref:Transposase n=1 Tax=Stigmatella ashevillensis TaxID=2995309 RepID=A0ABT5DLL6_9BACT|nr:transposase [Stigmatella ashevillena]MDC0714503.1 transposase [Stigmatella ashevillena]